MTKLGSINAAQERQRETAWSGFRISLCYVLLLAILSAAFITTIYQIGSSTFTVNIGEKNDQAHLIDFYGQERNAEFSYRWSKGSAYVSLPDMLPQSYRLSFRMHGGPPTFGQRQVSLRANDSKLADILVSNRLETYAFEYRPTVTDRRLFKWANLVLTIDADTVQEPGGTRQLGVMVDSVTVERLQSGLVFPPVTQYPTVIALVLSLYVLALGAGLRRVVALSVGMAGLAAGLLFGLYHAEAVRGSLLALVEEPGYVIMVGLVAVLALALRRCSERFYRSKRGIAAYLAASLLVAGAWYCLLTVGLGDTGRRPGDLYGSAALWMPVVLSIFPVSYAAAFAIGLTTKANKIVAADFLTNLAPIILVLYHLWQPLPVLGWDSSKPVPFLALGAISIGLVAVRASLLLRYLVSSASRALLSETRLRAVVAIGSLAVLLSLAGWDSDRIYWGDEPHYLVVTQSLLQDRDLNLKNNYVNRDYRTFFPFRLDGDTSQVVPGPKGALYPTHESGLSFTLVPGYLIAGKRGVEVELALLAAGLMVSFFSLCRDVGCSVRASLYAWLLVGFTSPFLIYSLQVYPEAIGALLLTVALRSLCVSGRSEWRQLLLGGLSLALMPWFHARFWIMVASVAPFALLSLKGRRIRLLAVAIPLLVSVGVFAVVDKVVYDIPLPNASVFIPKYFQSSSFVPPMEMIPRALGLLFDRTAGLIPTGPIYLMLPLAFPLLVKKRNARWRWPLLGVSAAYYLLCSAWLDWAGGWSAPGRFLVGLTPVFAVAIALAIDGIRGKTFQVGVFVLAAWSYFVAFSLEVVPDLRLFDAGTHVSYLNQFLSDIVHLDPGRVFPSFFDVTSASYALSLCWLMAILVASFLVYRRQATPPDQVA